MLYLTVYVGPECGECDAAAERLERLAPELGIRVRLVEITDIPELEEKWGSCIPAGVMRGKVIFKHALDEPMLRQKVRMLQR